MAVAPIAPGDMETIAARFAQTLLDITKDAETLAVYAASVLTEANRTGDVANGIEPLLIQHIYDSPDGPQAITWTTNQLTKMIEIYDAIGDFATFMRNGGASSPVARLQRMARPGGASRIG